MSNLIRRTARLLGLLLTPGTGTHRAGARLNRQQPAPHPHHPAGQLPPHRSPYGLDLAPFDGGTNPLVRPYLTAHEQEHRRRVLVLAADVGIDLDRHLIGVGGIAA